MKNKTFEPKILTVLREGYRFSLFTKDAIAGIIVGIIALPLSIAFAVASGVKPEQGIITGIVAGLLISLLSGSRVQIGGPTGAFIIIIFNIVQQHGYNGLAIATFLAGIFLIIMGLARMGDVIKFIPFPVTVGFTSGIAVVILTTQIPDFFGFQLAQLPKHFVDKWIAFATHLPFINYFSLLLGLLTILIIIITPRITKRIPGTFIAIIITTLLVKFFHLPVETIYSRFGAVPNTFPLPSLPHFSFDQITQLFSPALTIALLAGIESLLSAVVADGMMGTRHRSNMELIGQGVANIFSPLFGGIPATGAIARTAANIKNGGLTPFAGIIHAATLLIIFLFCAPLAGLIPMATLAGILITIAYNMSEWRLFKKLLSAPKADISILLITFFLTIFIDLTVAIEVGVVMAAFLFMHRMSHLTNIHLVNEVDEDQKPYEYRDVPEGIEIFEINGPLFFGAADKFRTALTGIKRAPRVIILRMDRVISIDATAAKELEHFINESLRNKTFVVLTGINRRLFSMLLECGIINKIGRDHIFSDISLAIAWAINLMENK